MPRVGASDIGQGSDTTLSQIAAETSGLNMDRIKIFTADTEMPPLDIGTYGSRITFIAGNAVKRAAIDTRDLLAEVLAEEFEALPQDI